MKVNPLKRLEIHRQSIWFEYIRSNLIESGELTRLIPQRSEGVS